jgi:hypothetical protein
MKRGNTAIEVSMPCDVYLAIGRGPLLFFAKSMPNVG